MTNKQTLSLLLSAACLISVLPLSHSQTIIQKTETFDTASSAAIDGWWEFGSLSPDPNPNDYGFSPTSNAGGPAGEAGGLEARNQSGTPNFYGDVFTTMRQFSLSNALTASGTMYIAQPMKNGNSRLCYFQFDTTNGTIINSAFGLMFSEPNNSAVPTGHRIQIFSAGNTAQANFLAYPNVLYTWNWTYTPPPAGANANGVITLTWLGNAYNTTMALDTSSNQFTYNFTSTQNPATNFVNGYGMYSDTMIDYGDPPETFTVFYDDLSYTAVSNNPAFVPRISVAPSAIATDLSLTNKASVTVIIPPQFNALSNYTVTLTSANPTICKPTGTSGTTNIVFTAAGNPMATVSLDLGPTIGATVLTWSAPGATFAPQATLSVNVILANSNIITKNETFDTAFSAGIDGWMEQASRANGMGYGFSPTQNAGGASAGEAGGYLIRNSARTAYADVWDSADYGRLSLSDSLVATGRVTFAGSTASGASFAIGFTDSTRVGQVGNQNQLALNFSTQGANRSRADIQIGFADGTSASATGIGGITGAAGTPLFTNRLYRFDFEWNPTGGINGGGLMTANLYDDSIPATYSGSLDLTPAQRNRGAVFDSFGIFNLNLATTAATITTNYVDDLTYTALPGGPCGIIAAVTSSSMVVPQTNNFFTVTIPGSISTNTAVTVNVVSTNPAVAYPAGAPGGTLTVTFPSGRSYFSTNVPIVAAVSGNTMFYIANASSPACISTALSNSVVTVSCGQVTMTPNPNVPQGATNQTVTIALTSGMNHSGPISVSINNTNPGVLTLQTATVTFPQGGYSTTNVFIYGLAVGTSQLSLTNFVGAGANCATLSAPFTVTVACSLITINQNVWVSVVGQTNQVISVTFPAFLNQGGAVTVDLKSLNPSVVLPHGAVGDTLALTFPAWSTNRQYVSLDVLGPGTATLVLTNNVSVMGCSSIPTNGMTVITVPQSDGTTNKTETFDSQAQAMTDGWTDFFDQTNGESYGFSATSNAGGSPGEAGGYLVRWTNRNYYADTQIGGLTLNDHISASGQFSIISPSVNANFNIAYFNTNDPNGGRDILGIGMADGTYPHQRLSIAVSLSTAGGGLSHEIFGPVQLYPPEVNVWSFTYDPTAGTNREGQLAVTYTANGNQWTTNYDLTVADRLAGANFNAFGMLVRASGGVDTTDTMGIYMDNLTYTKGYSLAPPPVAPTVTNPLSQTNQVGTTANFSATATGTAPLTYRWQFNNVPLSDNGHISGSATNALTIFGVGLADQGSYRLVVTNIAGSVTSAVANLVITGPPSIPLQLYSATTNLTFTWANTNFSLAFATNVLGPYVKIPGATSPFVTNTSGGTGFFRLVWP